MNDEIDIADAHLGVHRAYEATSDPEVREALTEEHAIIVACLLAVGKSHDVVDDLDATVVCVDDEGVEIRKADTAKRLVYGVVLEPNVVDAQGEWERPETIERTAHKYLASYNETTGLGVQHSVFGDIGADIVESYIAPQDLDFDGELEGDRIIRKGSWVMVVKVNDDDLWRGVQDGSITGFSIGGSAMVRG